MGGPSIISSLHNHLSTFSKSECRDDNVELYSALKYLEKFSTVHQLIDNNNNNNNNNDDDDKRESECDSNVSDATYSGDETSLSFSQSMGWTNIGCTREDCNDQAPACHRNNNETLHGITTTPNQTTASSQYFKGKSIRISGSVHPYKQKDYADMLLIAGASEVKMHTTLGDAHILIKGEGCSERLLSEAKRKNIIILTPNEVKEHLQRDGYSSPDRSSNKIDESKMASILIDKHCQFRPVSSQSNAHVQVEQASTKFTHPSILKRNGDKRQMKIVVTRVRSVGDQDWRISYKFHACYGGRQMWKRYCVTHDTELDKCKFCNKCTHLDPEKGIGYPRPNRQCVKCYPAILCNGCQLSPRLVDQRSCDPRYRKKCQRCYRIATGNTTSEDRSIQCLVDDPMIPVSSVDTEILGLKYRPDAEITETPYSDISFEHDDEVGHVNRTKYPAEDQHQRTVDLNQRREKARGKVTVRQHPLTKYESTQQTAQNAIMVSIVKRFMKRPLGQRSDGEGGKRVIVFIGFSHTNYHYEKALEEKKNGYWDEVHMVAPRN